MRIPKKNKRSKHIIKKVKSSKSSKRKSSKSRTLAWQSNSDSVSTVTGNPRFSRSDRLEKFEDIMMALNIQGTWLQHGYIILVLLLANVIRILLYLLLVVPVVECTDMQESMNVHMSKIINIMPRRHLFILWAVMFSAIIILVLFLPTIITLIMMMIVEIPIHNSMAILGTIIVLESSISNTRLISCICTGIQPMCVGLSMILIFFVTRWYPTFLQFNPLPPAAVLASLLVPVALFSYALIKPSARWLYARRHFGRLLAVLESMTKNRGGLPKTKQDQIHKMMKKIPRQVTSLGNLFYIWMVRPRGTKAEHLAARRRIVAVHIRPYRALQSMQKMHADFTGFILLIGISNLNLRLTGIWMFCAKAMFNFEYYMVHSGEHASFLLHAYTERFYMLCLQSTEAALKCLVIIYGCELFPTTIRCGSVTFSLSTGVIIAQTMVLTLSESASYSQQEERLFLLAALLSISGAYVWVLLPDTEERRKSLPDTMEEANANERHLIFLRQNPILRHKNEEINVLRSNPLLHRPPTESNLKRRHTYLPQW